MGRVRVGGEVGDLVENHSEEEEMVKALASRKVSTPLGVVRGGGEGGDC